MKYMFNKLDQTRLTKRNVAIMFSVLMVLVIGFLSYSWYDSRQVVIKSNNQQVTEGKISSGTSVAQKKAHIQTDSKLTFESKIIKPDIKNANAAVLKWSQDGADSGVDVELRTNNDGVWSEWSEAAGADERKDNTPVPRAALILGENIKLVQYRFKLTGSESLPSASVDTSATSLEMVDTTKGPEPTKPKSIVDKVLSAISLEKSVTAAADGPPIFSRAAWGAPEPYSSQRWAPEYRPISRVVVHHTATPFNSDVGAQLRAIWYYHANSLGWGDIGYNYVVDHGGNIFQGRYYNQAEADQKKSEVVGGHTYGNNYGTTGISVLGNFVNSAPTNAAMQSVANIAAYKMHKYDINPAAGSNLVGHRDLVQTACPGGAFYASLNYVRSMSSDYYYKYSSMFKLDSTFINEGSNQASGGVVQLDPGQTTKAFIDIKNSGIDHWSNNGRNPIYLGTDSPQDRISYFSDNSWIGGNRTGSFSYKVDPMNGQLTPATVIAPGEIARFEFMLTAPYQGGTYKESFHLLSEGRTWFLRNQGIHFIVQVANPTYSWQHISQNAYTDDSKATAIDLSSVNKNQRFFVVNALKNTSNQIWSKNGPSPLRLGTSGPRDRVSKFQDSTWLASSRPAKLNEETVKPGEIATFGYWMKAPSAVGTYKEYFNILAENRSWMTDYGMHWLMTVK